MLLLLACQPKSIDTSNTILDTSVGDTSSESPEEVDADGDGYPLWSSTTDIARADCDDTDPNVTPLTERYIPAGEFLRGENNTPWSSPQRSIELSDYCIDVYETTNQQFAGFMNEMLALGFDNVTEDGLELYDIDDDDDVFPERILIAAEGYRVMEGYEQHPVNEVFKWSGDAYCSFMERSLPTEAQWEKAARGEDGRTFPWGNAEPSCDLTNFGFINDQCVGDTVAVGSYPNGVSPYGVHDMAGNIAEWVSDWFGMDYYAQSPEIDPEGPEIGWFDDGQGNTFEARVVRSGNHATGMGDIQTHYRQPEPVGASSNGVGFRCARQLNE